MEKWVRWIWNIQLEAWIECGEDLFDGGSIAVVEDDVRVIVPGSLSVVAVGSKQGPSDDEVADVHGLHGCVENSQHLLEKDSIFHTQ